MSQLAEAVGLSVSSVSERVHKLEEKGIITKYCTKLESKYFGYDIMVFILVISSSSTYYETLTKKALKNKNILECYAILGEGSHILKAIVKNTAALEQLLAEIQSWKGVQATRTSFVLSAKKETSSIPLEISSNQ